MSLAPIQNADLMQNNSASLYVWQVKFFQVGEIALRMKAILLAEMEK